MPVVAIVRLDDLLAKCVVKNQMKINNLKISNFRCFKEYDINFDSKLTVLVANNSAGKTSILDAIAIAFGPYVGAFPLGKNKGFKSVDAMIIKDHPEPRYPIKIYAELSFEDKTGSISRELSSKGSSTTVKNTKFIQDYAKNKYKKLTDEQSINNVNLPIVAYYGTGRLWKNLQLTKTTKESHARSYGYHDCLNPASNYREFEKWFIECSIAEYHEIIKKVQLGQKFDSTDITTSNTELLNNIRKSINTALQHIGYENIRYDAELSSVVIENNEIGILSVELLSDGVKSMLAMVADIAHRCTRLNPHFSNASQLTKGVVLIDEVDMHLHPSWQQNVLNDLQTIFPLIQFIVTTHSPQVLSTVKQDSIRLIDSSKSKAVKPFVNPYGKQSIVALEDIMNVTSLPSKSVVEEVKLLEEYMKIINSGDIYNNALATMRQQLNATYGDDYIQLKIADMQINKFKASEQK